MAMSSPTGTSPAQKPATARRCVASTSPKAGAAAGFRKRPLSLQEPSRIFRSRRRRGEGQRRRQRQEAGLRRGPVGLTPAAGGRGRRWSAALRSRETLRAESEGSRGVACCPESFAPRWLWVSREARCCCRGPASEHASLEPAYAALAMFVP